MLQVAVNKSVQLLPLLIYCHVHNMVVISKTLSLPFHAYSLTTQVLLFANQ